MVCLTAVDTYTQYISNPIQTFERPKHNVQQSSKLDFISKKAQSCVRSGSSCHSVEYKECTISSKCPLINL